jgi:hypothetical protein
VQDETLGRLAESGERIAIRIVRRVRESDVPCCLLASMSARCRSLGAPWTAPSNSKRRMTNLRPSRSESSRRRSSTARRNRSCRILLAPFLHRRSFCKGKVAALFPIIPFRADTPTRSRRALRRF